MPKPGHPRPHFHPRRLDPGMQAMRRNVEDRGAGGAGVDPANPQIDCPKPQTYTTRKKTMTKTLSNNYETLYYPCTYCNKDGKFSWGDICDACKGTKFIVKLFRKRRNREYKKVSCSRCNGSGRDPNGGICYKCKGSKVKWQIQPENKDPNARTKREINWKRRAKAAQVLIKAYQSLRNYGAIYEPTDEGYYWFNNGYIDMVVLVYRSGDKLMVRPTIPGPGEPATMSLEEMRSGHWCAIPRPELPAGNDRKG